MEELWNMLQNAYENNVNISGIVEYLSKNTTNLAAHAPALLAKANKQDGSSDVVQKTAARVLCELTPELLCKLTHDETMKLLPELIFNIEHVSSSTARVGIMKLLGCIPLKEIAPLVPLLAPMLGDTNKDVASGVASLLCELPTNEFAKISRDLLSTIADRSESARKGTMQLLADLHGCDFK